MADTAKYAVAQKFSWPPAPGSPASTEMATLPHIRQAAVAAAFLWDHPLPPLKALAVLLSLTTRPEAGWVAPLSRSIVECSGVAFWIFAPEPLDPAARLARAMAWRARGANNLQQAAKKLDKDARVDDYGESPDRVAQLCKDYGLPAPRKVSNSGWECGGQTLPSYTAAANAMTAAVTTHAAWYSVASGISHAELFGIRVGFRERAEGGWEMATDAVDVLFMVAVSLLAACEAMACIQGWATGARDADRMRSQVSDALEDLEIQAGLSG